MEKRQKNLSKIWRKMRKDDFHESVLNYEVLKNLAPLNKLKAIDATVGTGGHALSLVKSGANVLGIEADYEMYEIAKERLEKACPSSHFRMGGSYKIVHGNFRNIDSIAFSNKFRPVDGVLFDLGVSNLQLMSKSRGFSFSNPEADLDMRIDKAKQDVKAKDLLNVLREDQLISLFSEVLPYLRSRFLVQRIIQARKLKPFESVGDFIKVAGEIRSHKKLHPATLAFLALRIAVNSELVNLKEALPKAFELLKKKGKLLIICFHSKEKEVFFDFVKQIEMKKLGLLVDKEPIRPKETEITINPRARSAGLWILQKI